MPGKNFNTEQLYIVPPLSVSYLHSYDALHFRWAPPLYEHLSVKSMSLSVSQTCAFMCPPVCFCVPTPVHFCILPPCVFLCPPGTLGLWVGLGCPLTATVLWFFNFAKKYKYKRQIGMGIKGNKKQYQWTSIRYKSSSLRYLDLLVWKVPKV